MKGKQEEGCHGIAKEVFQQGVQAGNGQAGGGWENNVVGIARDMGIHPNTLYRWVKEFSEKPDEAFPGKGHQAPEAEQIRQLKRENERLRMERDILKKAMAIFSKDPK